MKKKNLVFIITLITLVLTSCGKKTQDNNSTNEELLRRIGQLEEENKKLKKDYEAALSTVKMYTEQSVEDEDENKLDSLKETNVKETKTNNTLGINDDWIVDGQWKLKILDVKTTQDRNEYSDKNPAQVVIVSYTYENIGYEDEFMDGLFLTPEQIIDANGSVGYGYPAKKTHHADTIPVGSRVDIAEEAFGLNNQSNEVSINFVQYDGNGNKQKATFKVPVN